MTISLEHAPDPLIDRNFQKIASLLTPTGVLKQTPSYAANWSDFGSPYEGVSYSRFGNVVYLQGLCKKSIAIVAGETIFTLPTGYRPTAQVVFAIESNSAFGRVDVTVAGAVIVQIGGAPHVSLSGISFLVS
jgi:hypothetical protein